MLTTLLLAAFVALAPGQADKVVTKQNKVTVTATITKIDQKTRALTLRSENGDEDTFTAGPDVQRFSQLKVGDTISATFYEALVLELRKTGNPSTPSADTVLAGRTRQMPGGAVSVHQTRTVTVKAIDLNAGTITVATSDGRTMTRKAEDKKNLENVAVGDRIDITYTQALLVAADAKK